MPDVKNKWLYRTCFTKKNKQKIKIGIYGEIPYYRR